MKLTITAAVHGGYDSEKTNSIIMERRTFDTLPAAHAACLEALRDSDHGYAEASVDISYTDEDGSEMDFDYYTVATRSPQAGEKVMRLEAFIQAVGEGLDEFNRAGAKA